MPERPPYRGRVDRIEGTDKQSDHIEKMREQFDQSTVRRDAEKPSKERPDQFREDARLPHYINSIEKRIGTGYRTFKLPGTNYVVRDQREEGARKGEAFKKDPGYEMKDGQLAKAKEKSYVNYLGDRQVLQPDEARGLAREISRLLSEFEKLLIDRFEKGKILEQETADGKPNFGAKSAEQWRSFFSKFLGRTVWRDADLKMLKEFIFRGLIDLKRGDGKYAVLIGDMELSNGQIEKFARLRVLSDLLEMLANARPGSSIEEDLIRKGIGKDELKYLALAHKHTDHGIKTAKDTTKGMFGELRTEEEVASRLGISRRKKGGGAYGGPIKWGDKDSEEEKHGFVPWGFWEREKRGRPWPKLFTKVLFTIIILILFATIWAIVRAFV